MNTGDCSEYLGVSSKTLERMRVEGNGPPFKKIGHRVMYGECDIQKWVDGNTFRSTSEFYQRKEDYIRNNCEELV